MGRNYGLNALRSHDEQLPNADRFLLPIGQQTPSETCATPGPFSEGFSFEYRDRVCLAWLALFLGSLVAFVIAFVLLLNRLA